MRILHVINHIQKIGNGIVNGAIDLACPQAQADHGMAIASGSGQFEALLAQDPIEPFEFDATVVSSSAKANLERTSNRQFRVASCETGASGNRRSLSRCDSRETAKGIANHA